MHGRGEGSAAFEWGVSGYVYDNVFILFDRATESLWYPLEDGAWTAIAGPRQGEVIPFMDEPGVMSLGDWRARHPGTVVLLGDARDYGDGPGP